MFLLVCARFFTAGVIPVAFNGYKCIHLNYWQDLLFVEHIAAGVLVWRTNTGRKIAAGVIL